MADKALGTAPSNAADVATKGYVDVGDIFKNAQVAYVATSENTTSASYADLTTTTDQVTVTVGSSGMVLLLFQSWASLNAVGNVYLSCAISGTNSSAASDATGCTVSIPASGYSATIFWGALLPSLASGSTTFKLKYKVSNGTGSFKDRRITVIPL